MSIPDLHPCHYHICLLLPDLCPMSLPHLRPPCPYQIYVLCHYQNYTLCHYQIGTHVSLLDLHRLLSFQIYFRCVITRYVPLCITATPVPPCSSQIGAFFVNALSVSLMFIPDLQPLSHYPMSFFSLSIFRCDILTTELTPHSSPSTEIITFGELGLPARTV